MTLILYNTQGSLTCFQIGGNKMSHVAVRWKRLIIIFFALFSVIGWSNPETFGVNSENFKTSPKNNNEILALAKLDTEQPLIHMPSYIYVGHSVRPPGILYDKPIKMIFVGTFYATSYSPEESLEMGGGDKTFLEHKAGCGHAAIDPKFWKLGTRFYVPGVGKLCGCDTGGRIEGKKRMDIGWDTKEQMKRFGTRKVKVYLLPE